MTDEITPALSPEEWDRMNGPAPVWAGNDLNVTFYHGGAVSISGAYEGGVQSPAHLHAIAALALHGQPFGFTWEDVEELRRQSRESPGLVGARFASIADRIAALLPPRPL